MWSVVWFVAAAAFGVWFWWHLNGQLGAEVAGRKTLEYATGYLIEKGLAIENVFVWDSGGLFVYEVDSAEAASAIVAEDPFSINGVYEKVEIKPWTLVFVNVELFRTNT